MFLLANLTGSGLSIILLFLLLASSLSNSKLSPSFKFLALLLPLSLRKLNGFDRTYCYDDIKTKANYGFVYAHNFTDFVGKNTELTLNITPKGRKSISDIAGLTNEGIGVNNAI